jgi:hypothetical protein
MSSDRFWTVEKVALLMTLALGFGLLIFMHLNFVSTELQYIQLAESFALGRLDIGHVVQGVIPPMDSISFGGKYYWPLGPLPAVLATPFLGFVPRHYIPPLLQTLLTVGLFIAAFITARRIGFRGTAPYWLATALCFGSVAIGAVMDSGPWHLANTLTVLVLMLAVREHVGKDRPEVVGIFMGLAQLTRFTAGLPIIFFVIMELSRSSRSWSERLRRAARLLWPFAVAVALLGAYNYLRFGGFFETGHTMHFLGPSPIRDRLIEYGIFSIQNVPRNVYYYFLKLPELVGSHLVVDPRGVSVFLLSPVFMWAAYAFRGKDRKRVLAVVAATVVCLAVFLTYFTTGFRQFGPRYVLDFLPLWYLLLLSVFMKRGFGALPKATIAVSVMLNVYLYSAYISATFKFT